MFPVFDAVIVVGERRKVRKLERVGKLSVGGRERALEEGLST
jgi:hypothetical protein